MYTTLVYVSRLGQFFPFVVVDSDAAKRNKRERGSGTDSPGASSRTLTSRTPLPSFVEYFDFACVVVEPFVVWRMTAFSFLCDQLRMR